MFVLDDSRCASNWDGVVREVRGLLERRGAEILTCDRWDERRLAYPIKHRTRAVYLLARFTAPSGALGPIKRDCGLADTVLRVLITRDLGSEKLAKAGQFPPPPTPAGPTATAGGPAESASAGQGGPTATAGGPPAPAPGPAPAPAAVPEGGGGAGGEAHEQAD
jgi:ribosomal protein S6